MYEGFTDECYDCENDIPVTELFEVEENARVCAGCLEIRNSDEVEYA